MKKKKTKAKKPEKSESFGGDALDGCGSISQWEERHGRGFWGNESSGYITDEQLKKMR